MALKYMLAADAAIVLDYKGTSQAVVSGLNKMGAPGATRSVVEIDEFRNDFARMFTGGGKYNDISFGGNLVYGDTKGQDVLRAALKSRRAFVGKEMLCFLNSVDFFTTDIANDPSSGMQIGELTVGEADKNGVFALTGKIIPNGNLAVYTAHLTEGATPTTAFVSSTTKTITDSASRFVTAGFVAGMSLLIIGSTGNDTVSAIITNVAAGTLTLDIKSGTLTAQSGITGMELHGGTF